MRDQLASDVGRSRAASGTVDAATAFGFGSRRWSTSRRSGAGPTRPWWAALVNVIAEHGASPDVAQRAGAYVRWLRGHA
jgi:hypothetical protein